MQAKKKSIVIWKKKIGTLNFIFNMNTVCLLQGSVEQVSLTITRSRIVSNMNILPNYSSWKKYDLPVSIVLVALAVAWFRTVKRMNLIIYESHNIMYCANTVTAWNYQAATIAMQLQNDLLVSDEVMWLPEVAWLGVIEAMNNNVYIVIPTNTTSGPTSGPANSIIVYTVHYLIEKVKHFGDSPATAGNA